MTGDLRCGVGVPNVGAFGDPLLLVELAVAAEEHGWDGFFVWDHLLYHDQAWDVADPVAVIAAVAARTARIRIGVLVNILARRWIGEVARESVTLDLLSGGRLVVGAGLGSLAAEFTAFGQSADARQRAARLDESLGLLDALWTGEPVTVRGQYLTAIDVQMLPRPVQRPRIPVWCGGRWPNKAPFRRAARWDGVMPTHAGYGLGQTMPPDELRAVVQYTSEHRTVDGPFDVVLEGRTDGAAPGRGAEQVAPYLEAGLTWWIEALGWWRGTAQDALTRIRQGPPEIGATAHALSSKLERVSNLVVGPRRVAMAIVQTLPPSSDGHRRLGLASPATGESVGEITVSTPAEVDAAIARARAAQPAWAALPAADRAAVIAKALDVLLARKDEICATVQGETGKPLVEALAIEIVPSCDFINYWAGRAAKDLADERVGLHGYMKPLKKLYIHYQPLGVVGVITPWNGPFVLSINPAVQALLAGNAVVLKPSEVTPYSGAWAAKVLWEAGVPEDVLQLVQGDGESGAALVNGAIDKISFTGSVGTGKKVAAACAERLIPCSLELGGKDAMIVCADADLERAANGAVYLSMFNSGQVCVGVERIYVVDSVADEFIRLVREKAAAVTYGQGNDVGPLFWDRQLEIVSRHVEDARAKGATILVGGGADTGKGLFYRPTVVVDLTHDMDLMSEETFGPVVAIMRVKDEDEAVRLANDSRYGLSGSVFTKDPQRVIRIGKQLKTGSVVHNDAAVIYGVAEAPFGGRKDSGMGQVNGRNAIRGYTHALPILIDRWGRERENIWYPYADKTVKTLESTIKFVFGNHLVRRFMR